MPCYFFVSGLEGHFKEWMTIMETNEVTLTTHRPVTAKHNLHIPWRKAVACSRKAAILGLSSIGPCMDRKQPYSLSIKPMFTT